MAKKRELPPEVFQVVSSLFPHFISIFEECKITPSEFFVLSYTKHFGKPHHHDRTVILRSEIGDALQRTFQDPKVSKLLKGLVDRGFISKTSLSTKEMKELYGKDKGRTDALILLEHGAEKLSEFNGHVNDLFMKVSAGVPWALTRPFSTLLKKFSSTLLKSIRTQEWPR
jgi:DNA-binding MarR family transcriptional regulator